MEGNLFEAILTHGTPSKESSHIVATFTQGTHKNSALRFFYFPDFFLNFVKRKFKKFRKVVSNQLTNNYIYAFDQIIPHPPINQNSPQKKEFLNEQEL